jgi:uncharacterized protein (TIRG00374 family)
MSGGNLRATVVGFGAAVLVVGLLVVVSGVDRLVAQLRMADLRYVALVLVTTLVWLVAWGVALRTVLDVLGVELPVHIAFLVFAGAMFSNNVTPFGQAGGEPVTALLVSRVTDAEYETGLAAIASVDTLNFVPSITLALVGVGFYATEIALGQNRNVLLAVGAVVVLALAVPSAAYAAWQRRYELEQRVVDRLTPLIGWLGRVVPRVTPPSPADIERRINGFFRAIERIATEPGELAVALAFSALGWLAQGTGLWLAFEAIGAPINFSLVLFAVPIGAIAGVTPLPGGVGGIEWVLATLLAAATGPAVGFGTATAAVVIFRGSVYWTPVVIGGVVMSVYGVRGR